MKDAFYPIVLSSLLLLVGCGSGSEPSTEDLSVNENQTAASTIDTKTVQTPEDLIKSDYYSGELVVYFREELGIRVATPASEFEIPQTPFTKGGIEGGLEELNEINAIMGTHGSVEAVKFFDLSDEALDKRRAYLEELGGDVKLRDWNSVYRLKVADRNEAVALYNELGSTAGVEAVVPRTHPVLLGVSSSTTPDLSGQQGYLKSDLFGGLNAEYAWGQGIHGKDVMIFDDEYDFNYLHEDLQPVTINGKKWYGNGPCPAEDPTKWEHPINGRCEEVIAHGTSISSILNAAHTSPEFGVKSFAKDSIFTVNGNSNISPSIERFLPGSVLVIETGTSGKDSPATSTGYGYDAASQRGQMPREFLPECFDYYRELTADGVTVVEGGANGEVNFDDPSQYEGKWSIGYKNLSKEDSGAIMVGASKGANFEKAYWSNWGKRVNAYAWGVGVVSASYPYGDPKDSPYYWSGPNGPPNKDNNMFYTNRSGGTSAAAAMVAGAVALTQSYFRKLAGEGLLRYIMPLKMREMVIKSGIKQKDSTGKNIGVQPRIDQMFREAEGLWATMKNKYPELASGKMMTKQAMLDMRRDGIGIICLKQYQNLPVSHMNEQYIKDERLSFDWSEWGITEGSLLCPEEVMWPRGEKIAVDMDMDGDGKSDIISWRRGEWRVDLSSRGETKGTATDYDGNPLTGFKSDNFGEWDLIINYKDTPGKWVLPYVHDMNSDTRADLMLYEKDTGKWYIAYTDTEMTAEGIPMRGMKSWDKVIQYDWKDTLEMDPWKSKYSRPAVGNMDKDANWADIAITTSDGYWMIDSGGPNGPKGVWGPNGPDGIWDYKVKFLTEAQLAAAPGWAYGVNINNDNGSMYLRIPDTLPEEGRLILYGWYKAAEEKRDYFREEDLYKDLARKFGDNSKILIPLGNMFGGPVSLFSPGEDWETEFIFVDLDRIGLQPDSYPAISTRKGCKPLVSDFDAEDRDQSTTRAMQCIDEFVIIHKGKYFAPEDMYIRHIPLGYDPSMFTLPGRPYVGGIKYADTLSIIDLHQILYPSTPPPIIVDMVER